MQLKFSICSWGAWSPQYQQSQDWQQWKDNPLSQNIDLPDAPKLAQIPAMKRRRFSRLTKMQLEAAFQTDAPQSCRTIFSSRHGELERTLGLLDNIVTQEPLSPIAFSQSVHNTASGIYSILKENRAASTSIAAGKESLPQALFEAFAQLTDDPSPLLLVFADQPVPGVYSQFVEEPELPLSMAFLLTLVDNQKPAPELVITPAREQAKISYGQLLHSLANKKSLAGDMCNFHWEVRFD